MTPAAGKIPRALIYAMMALVVITLLLARSYYRRKNLSVDPRIVPARNLYENYNALATSNDYKGVICLLDSIEEIYNRYPHYRGSFETGVLENNRAALYLTLGLSYDRLASPYHFLGQDSLMALGESAARRSIDIYEHWLSRYEGKSNPEIQEEAGTDFGSPSNSADPEKQAAYLENRVKEIGEAIRETPRRLSVSYTNLGIAYRYREDYHAAASCYQKALVLWEDNLTAENNLNILLGKPLKKRNFIQKMFPKPK
jgi:tetratricopeptide (TPR) repeat protein